MRRVAFTLLLVVGLGACASPVTVAGDAGDLTLPRGPERIVSLSATHTEILYALGRGDLVVAVDLTSDYPAEVDTKPRVDAFNFDVEEIASFDPDLVITAFDFQGEIAALERVGIPALLLGPATTLDDAYAQIETLGAVTDSSRAAEQLVLGMKSRIGELVGRARGSSLSVFHEVDSTLFSANSSTFLGDIYRRLGLTNIADAVPDEFGSGYPQVSEEYLFAEDPDVIFLGDAQFGESRVTVTARAGWETLTAVQRGAVFELDGDLASRWGPRTVMLVSEIVEAIEAAG